MELIKYLEEELNQTANIEFLKIQPGDVEVTYANIDHAKEKLNYKPKISIKEGIKFIEWFTKYHEL